MILWLQAALPIPRLATPGTGQYGAFRGLASDKPQGRKRRAGTGTTVIRAEAMGVSVMSPEEVARLLGAAPLKYR